MALQQTDVFGIMRADLDRVDARVAAAAELDLPAVDRLVGDIVRAGGKRLRPLVLLLAGRAYGGDLETLVTAAAGVELLHTASLVHDDTVDHAALRRGKPTLNSQFGSGAVILVGDYLFAQSAMLAAATGSPRVVSVFASTLGDICHGQLREMFDAHRLTQSRQEYEERIYGKTASLFAGSAEMGAIIGGATEPQIASLREYGGDLGMAFQIVDDILDLTGGTHDLGKPAGNDLRQGTVTLPVMLYHAGLAADAPQRRRLEQIIAGDLDDPTLIDEAVGEIRRSPAIADAALVARDFADRAESALSLVPDRETRDLLADVAHFAVHRLS